MDYPEGLNWTQFILQFGSAFVGALFALLIFWLGEKNISKRQKKRDFQHEYSQVMYLLTITNSLILNTSKSKNIARDYARIVNDKPFNFHPLPVQVNNDAERITDKINQSDLFKSYLSVIGENQNLIHLFNDLFIKAAYFNELHNQSKDVIQRNEKFFDLEYKKIIDLFEVIRGIFETFLLNYEKGKVEKNEENKGVYNLYREVFDSYLATRKTNPDFEVVKEAFFMPIAEQLSKNYANHELSYDSTKNCRLALDSFDQIKIISHGLEETFNMYAQNFEQIEKDLKAFYSTVYPILENSINE